MEKKFAKCVLYVSKCCGYYVCIVAEQVEKEKMKFKKQLDEISSDLVTARHELAQSKKAEELLVEQQNQMSIELITEKREREKATMEMKR